MEMPRLEDDVIGETAPVLLISVRPPRAEPNPLCVRTGVVTTVLDDAVRDIA
jgi:hypothetical protein